MFEYEDKIAKVNVVSSNLIVRATNNLKLNTILSKNLNIHIFECVFPRETLQ